MEILASAQHAMGAEFKLVKVDDDFFMYGTQDEFDSIFGVSVDRCGSLEEVLNHCLSISKLCEQNIKKYQKFKEKDNHSGWDILIENEKSELKMLLHFAEVLDDIR